MNEAIILAGGFGTRLRSVVSDLPKPMAPVAGKPFLEYLLTRLAKQHYTHVILSTGYLHETIEQHFGSCFEGIELSYAVEDTPLGTGGAIVNALQHCKADDVSVLNGDTLFNIDLMHLRQFRSHHNTPLAIVLRQVDDARRYGTVQTDANGRIVAFCEKKETFCSGLINGGIYQISRSLLSSYPVGTPFSFERDVMQQIYNEIPVFAYIDNAYFIDIGIPEDYLRAQKELPLL